ncbi:hypothetical protein BJ508DRAFT_311696 [Ascobolus immersus RN42]|uniref:Uncharacterized protein n=1 Tax=Ascobolus immersus RN42 TaxID=1160509 RepID=A0A3N4I1M9_ASCIM|nr:hypothetical protein BJ508DRAFT_311696 [Ascobolus immersus RN42]
MARAKRDAGLKQPDSEHQSSQALVPSAKAPCTNSSTNAVKFREFPLDVQNLIKRDYEEYRTLGALALKPLTLAPKDVYPFLAICERECGLYAYNNVLMDCATEEFLSNEGCSNFMVMLYPFEEFDRPSEDPEQAEATPYTQYVLAFVNAKGGFCAATEEDGVWKGGFTWVYSPECFERACGFLKAVARTLHV